MKPNRILAWTLLLLMGCTVVKAQTLPYQDQTLSFHERAVDLVSRLTLAEKAQQMGNMVENAVNRDGINIPAYQYWNEALHGVARSGAATSFPESKGMSATWDRQLIFDCATAISDEARVYNNLWGKGLNYWCPTINMSRDPRWGRDEENYGEDPFLAGQLAVQFIKGMQGDDPKYLKTVACAKHFAANNYEQGRQGSTSFMTKHNLREYYLPAFEMAVKEGKVKSIMSSYNALSTNLNEKNAAGEGWSASKSRGGKPNAMNDWLLNGILRNEWGFDGYVTSDCAGVSCIYRNVKHFYYGNIYGTYDESNTDVMEKYQAHATADAIKAGNDMNCEFKNQTSVFQTAVQAAIAKGYMTEADLDKALIRVLETRFALGEFDGTNPWSSLGIETLESDANQALALKAAQESIVLLKNETPQGGDAPILPLSTEKSIAIIGPYANQIMLGDYSGTPTYTTTPFQAISQKMNFTVTNGIHNFTDYDRLGYAKQGEANFKNANGYVENTKNGDWIVFDEIDFGSGCADFVVNCATKTGQGEGTINFYLDLDDEDVAAATTENAALSISNSSVATGGWGSWGDVTASVDPNVFKGKHKVTIKFISSQSYVGNWKTFRFYNEGVEPLETQGPVFMVQTSSAVNEEASAEMIARAVAVAQKADVVVFCGGTDYSKPANHATGTESHDRFIISMPGNQTALLQALYAVNKNVVLVLESNSSMDITWEKANLPAIVEAWYGGQAQGQAISDVLYGDVNPSGKLTSTWYNRLEELPSASDSKFGADGMLEYNIDEWGYTYMYYGKGTGANVSRQAAKPMYPFGYGLSYTTFEYSNAAISSTEASCTITNTGNRKGAEVVQVYVSFPNSSVSHIQKLNRRLVGFDRVELEPGESKVVTIPINKKQLAYFNDDTDEWWVEGGTVNVHIAASSDDDRLTGSFTATREMLEKVNNTDNEVEDPNMQTVPGGIDLNSGTYGNCQVEQAGNVGYIRNNSTATYEFKVTKAGPYNFSWDLTRYNGTTVNVNIINLKTGVEEVNKDLTIPALSNYANDLQALGSLTTGIKRMTLTFHCDDGYVCNYKNLALRYAGDDLEYYDFTLNVTGGPASLVTMTASPAANAEGKYEEGTLITLKAVDNTLFSFQQWSDESTETTKTVKLTANTELTATYQELESYLAGWDFTKGYSANADYAKREENESASLYLVNKDGTKAGNSYWNRGGYAQIWVAGEYDYVARLNARNYKDITLQSKLNYNYNVWRTTKIQYSTDGTTWTDVDGASLTFTQNGWQSLNATLPEACNHAEKLYIRWASVREGALIGSTSDYRALQISDIYVLGDYETYQDPVAPAVTFTTPQAGSQLAKRSGTITLNFDKNVQLDGQATLNGQQLDGEAFGARITFPYSGLESNTEYTFTLPAGAVKNENNIATTADITLTFKTVARATVAKKRAFDFVVGTDGTADEAMAAANASGAERFYIFVPDGEWELQGNTSDPGKKTNVQKTVSIIGQSRDGAVLFNSDDSEDGWGIAKTATLNLQGQHSYLQDLTVKNWRGKGNTGVGVAVALSEKGYNIYKNVAIWSNQDTYVSGGTNYWEGGRISGSVDYICGGGDIWFEGTELMNTRTGSVITAPSHNSETWGYVFNNCSVGSYYTEDNVPTGASVCGNGGYTFGRPWQKAPRTTMLNTICNILPSDAGWQDMGAGLAFHFNEFGSVSKSGTPLDLSGRNVAGIDQTNPECDTNPVLSQAEADVFTLDAVMGNSFTPTAYTEQCDAPVISSNGMTLTWTGDSYALCYVIFRDGAYEANVTTNSYEVTKAGRYTVCAANEMGGLGNASNAIDFVFYDENEDNAIAAATGATVKLTRTITANKWSSICLPFAMTESQLKGAFGDDVKIAELSSAATSTLGFSLVTATVANQPYAIKVGSDFVSTTIENVTIVEATPQQAVGDWTFAGTYTAIKAPVGSYIFSGNKLHRVTGYNVNVKAFRGYFTSNDATANELTIVIDGETTGLSEIERMRNGENETFYDLQGRRVAQPAKGLYIVNGKKVVIK